MSPDHRRRPVATMSAAELLAREHDMTGAWDCSLGVARQLQLLGSEHVVSGSCGSVKCT